MSKASKMTREEASIAQEVNEFLRKGSCRSKPVSKNQLTGSKVEVISKKGEEITKRIIIL